MSEKLENIFNECLDRIAQGESIESCLQSYPTEAAQLEPLLRTAFGFNWRASAIEPRPEFRAQARAQIQFQGAQLYATRAGQPQHTGIFTWQRAWVVALTAILLFVLTGVGTVAASSSALPDQALYPVKLATEEIRLVLATSDAEKAQLHTQLAETRATEIETMARQGKTDQVVATTDRMIEHLDEASIAFAVAEQRASAATPQPADVTLEATPTPVPTEEEPTQPTDTTTEAASTTVPTEEEPTQPTDNTTEATSTTVSTEEEPMQATTPPAEATPVPTTTEPSSSGKTTESSKTTQQRERVYKLNQAMIKSNSRSLAALRRALEEAPPEMKPALQRAIDALLEKEHKKFLNKSGTDNQQQSQEQEQNQEQEQEQGQNQDQEQNQEQESTQDQEPRKATWFKKQTRNQISVQKTTNNLDNKTGGQAKATK